jgi:hypothetical protein
VWTQVYRGFESLPLRFLFLPRWRKVNYNNTLPIACPPLENASWCIVDAQLVHRSVFDGPSKRNPSRLRVGRVSRYLHHGALWLYYRDGGMPLRRKVI